jgi:hypothetical protein
MISKNRPKPPRIVVHGPPGIGKTTFAARADEPVFICTEDGMGTLDVPMFPLVQSYNDLIDALAVLGREDHGFKTVVIDSLDWAEPMVWQSVCDRKNVKSIEDLGYGKGYLEAMFEWNTILDYLTALRDHKDMTVILLAHSQIKRIEDPLHPPYDSHDLKLHTRAAARVREFADIIGFATIDTKMRTDDTGFGNKRARAVDTGERTLHVSASSAFAAKNRYGLPSPMPLDYQTLMQHFSNKEV